MNLILIFLLTNKIKIDYSNSRLISAGLIFMITYTAHRKITFTFVKKVGIAIYLNKNESVPLIYKKIKNYADFIHLDLVDSTFKGDSPEIDLEIIKEINKTWAIKKMLHIMSNKPSIWIKKLNSVVDVIIFHLGIEENPEEIISLCKKHNKKVGIALAKEDSIQSLIKYLHKIDFVQVMGINSLGKSGQSFEISSLEKIKQLNELKKRYSFEIIFDGGVKTTNINRINAKYIVSSSELLNSKNPKKSFMELKTSARYTSIDKKLKRNILLGIRKTVESLEFVESGSIVGSFSEGKGISGINDIDIVVILDKLTKEKFLLVLDKFNELKKEIESRYAYPVYINNTLGPLKFNNKSIVFHLMIYDNETHKQHCLNSPFTCFDWQRSKIFIKKPISEVYPVWDLQLKNFFNARRGVEEYLSEIESGKLSYRTYTFKGNKVIEEKQYKVMDARDKIEFAYHITRFLMTNFLKIYYFKNKSPSYKKLIKHYFSIFPNNSKLHKKRIKYLLSLKKKNQFIELPWLSSWVELFISDFESQFKELFEIK